MSNEIRGPEHAPAEAGLGPAAPSVEFESMTVMWVRRWMLHPCPGIPGGPSDNRIEMGH